MHKVQIAQRDKNIDFGSIYNHPFINNLLISVICSSKICPFGCHFLNFCFQTFYPWFRLGLRFFCVFPISLGFLLWSFDTCLCFFDVLGFNFYLFLLLVGKWKCFLVSLNKIWNKLGNWTSNHKSPMLPSPKETKHLHYVWNILPLKELKQAMNIFLRRCKDNSNNPQDAVQLALNSPKPHKFHCAAQQFPIHLFIPQQN